MKVKKQRFYKRFKENKLTKNDQFIANNSFDSLLILGVN